MDDGWICDDDICNEDGIEGFLPESESQSLAPSSALPKGPNGEIDEEQRQKRLERKELDRIARRFRVITPAEFEKNLSMVSQGDALGVRQADSWCGLN